MHKTLALILAALALIIGSFIWFVASWDASAEDSLSSSWPVQLPPEATKFPNFVNPPAAGAILIEKATT